MKISTVVAIKALTVLSILSNASALETEGSLRGSGVTDSLEDFASDVDFNVGSPKENEVVSLTFYPIA